MFRSLHVALVLLASLVGLAMLDMIDNGKAYQAHPAHWAPFIVVGEGAAAK